MIQLQKGGNAPLSTTSLTVTVDVAANADLSALLVTEAGKVRSDADFVFYNQPNGPGVQCVPPAAGQPWQIRLDLAQVPADVHAVRVVSSLDDHGKVFGQVGQPVARVADGSGQPVAEFVMTGLDRELIVVLLELYRRGGDWKVRAVGRGYDGGLADLVTDHGVSVDDTSASAAAAPAPAPFQAPPPSPPAQPPSWPPAAAPPAAAPPAAAPPVAAPPVAAPVGAPRPPGGAPGQGGSTGEVSLTKGRPVSLTKGQKVTLTKDGGVALTQVRMGLGWDPIKRGGFFGGREVDIDLDASAVLFAGGRVADVAFYNQLRTKDGSVQHLGDNLTGVGEGDDEVIDIDLTRLPSQVDTVVLVVTSYQGQTFEQVQNAFCRLVDQRDGELARFALAGGMPFTALVMAKLYRDGGGWKMQALGEGIQARMPSEAVPQLTRFL